MIAELYNASADIYGKRMFSVVSFVARPGDRVALIGDGGTFVLQSLLGMCRLSEGYASIDGEALLPQLAAYVRRNISYIPKNMEFGNVTLNEVAKYLFGCNKRIRHPDDIIGQNLEAVGVDKDCLQKPFCQLQPAIAQRAVIAITFGLERHIALLDSPTSAQDEYGRQSIAKFIASKRFDEISVIVASDDPVVIAVCNKRVNLRNS